MVLGACGNDMVLRLFFFKRRGIYLCLTRLSVSKFLLADVSVVHEWEDPHRAEGPTNELPKQNPQKRKTLTNLNKTKI